MTVEYVRSAVGVELAYDSDTLPLLDHYLRRVNTDQTPTLELIVTTAAAYFGELVRRYIGGRWENLDASPAEWRMVMPTGLTFAPAGYVAAAIARREPGEFEAGLDVPARMRTYLENALARMSPVSEDEFYSLCGRLDTLEHVHEVLVAVAAELVGDQASADDDGGPELDDDALPPTADVPDVN